MQATPPPTLQYLFLEQPLPMVLALIGIAVVLRLLARRRNDATLDRGALVAILAAVAVFITAGLVTTDHEHLLQRTRQLIMATAPLDAPQIDTLLTPHATLSGPDGTVWLQYEQIRRQLPNVVQRYQVTGHRIRETAAELRSPTWGHSYAAINTYLDQGTALPIQTLWALTWQKDPDEQWRVNDIRWVEFQNQRPTQGLWN